MDERKMSESVPADGDAGVSRERKRHGPRQIVGRLRDKPLAGEPLPTLAEAR